MKMKIIIGAVCLGALLGACGGDDKLPAIPAVPAHVLLTGKALQDELERVRATNGLPGLSVVTVENGKIEAASTGKRIVGGAVPISPTDQFQVGSLSKGTTAMLIARLVEQKKLRWDSNLSELFPAWSAKMQPSLRSVTVEQLLRHRGGFKRDMDEADAVDLRPLATGDVTVDRATVAEYLLRQTPAFPPNSKYLYSNVGYMLVGLIAETAGGGTYANLMEKEVFAPLRIKASFGFPEYGGPGVLSGHELDGATWQPAIYGAEQRQILALMEPGGGLMVSMADYGKYLHEHLQGLQGKSAYLGQDTFRLMHTAVDSYGLGWWLSDDPATGRVSAHDGSNGSYYSFTILVPESKRAIAISCNCYGAEAIVEIDKLTRRLAFGRE